MNSRDLAGCSGGSVGVGALAGGLSGDDMRIKTRTFPGAGQYHQPVTDGGKDGSESENVRELRLKLENSQEECSKLHAAVVELTQVNKRWQRYNNDRQLYVQRLLNTIQDQQEQLNEIGERTCTSTSTSGTSVGQNSSSSLGDDAAEIGSLRTVEKKLREKVSILEFQVKAHRDDWEAELNEKKQVLKDKEALERKLAKLLYQHPGANEKAESRVDLFCQNCGRVLQFASTPPSPSRLYRSAVHLPCSSSSRQSSSTSISTTGDELVIDSCGGGSSQPDCGGSLGLNLPVADASCYSRSSTLPLREATPKLTPTPTVKSYVQIPVAKSSSLPEGRAAKFPELPLLEPFKSAHDPPVTVVNSDQYEGVHTFTAEDVICLRCGQVFPPSKHLQFLDHFSNCKSTNCDQFIPRNSDSS